MGPLGKGQLTKHHKNISSVIAIPFDSFLTRYYITLSDGR